MFTLTKKGTPPTADEAKLQQLVDNLLTETLESGKTLCFADLDVVLDITGITQFDYSTVGQAVRDYTCSDEFGEKFGTWVFTEFGDGYWVFSRLSDKVILASDVDAGDYPFLQEKQNEND